MGGVHGGGSMGGARDVLGDRASYVFFRRYVSLCGLCGEGFRRGGAGEAVALVALVDAAMAGEEKGWSKKGWSRCDGGRRKGMEQVRLREKKRMEQVRLREKKRDGAGAMAGEEKEGAGAIAGERRVEQVRKQERANWLPMVEKPRPAKKRKRRGRSSRLEELSIGGEAGGVIARYRMLSLTCDCAFRGGRRCCADRRGGTGRLRHRPPCCCCSSQAGS